MTIEPAGSTDDTESSYPFFPLDRAAKQLRPGTERVRPRFGSALLGTGLGGLLFGATLLWVASADTMTRQSQALVTWMGWVATAIGVLSLVGWLVLGAVRELYPPHRD
jgi:uncharacterized membrane protein YcjF (UPF0283 family)